MDFMYVVILMHNSTQLEVA